MRSIRDGPSSSGSYADEMEKGELIIDESGQVEIPPENEASPFIPTNAKANIPPVASPFTEEEGIRSATTPITAPYDQQIPGDHSPYHPANKAPCLNIGSSSLRKGHRYHYAASVFRKLDEKEDSYAFNHPTSSNSVVHCNGIWTPTMTMAHNNSSYTPNGQYDGFSQGHSNTGQNSEHNGLGSSSGPGLQHSFLYDLSHNQGSSASATANSTTSNGYQNQGSSLNGGSNGGGSNSNNAHQNYKSETTPSPNRQYRHSSSPNRESPITVEETIKNSFFTQDKVDTLCDIMLRDKSFSMLEHILKDLPKGIHDSENVLRARAALAYHNGNYQLLYNILDSREFSQKHHRELQDLYQLARYHEAQKVRGRPLGAVDKYRVRRKYSLPRTIWDGEVTSYNFREKDRRLLIEAYDQGNRYPTAEVKKKLQILTGLDKKQIDNWFKNRRQREAKEGEEKVVKPRKGKGKDGLVSMPASSHGSGTSSLYPNVTLHTVEDETLDLKYSPYIALTQYKGFNVTQGIHDVHDVSPPLSADPTPRKNAKGAGKRPRKNGQNGNGNDWGEVDASVSKRRRKGDSGNTSPRGDVPSLPDGYFGHRLKANGTPNTVIVNFNNGVENEGHTHNQFERNGNGNGSSSSEGQNHHQHYSSSNALLMSHHQHAMSPWTNWHHPSSAGSMGAEGGYPPINILPSLAASFNHHPHHHALSSLNSENRIPVQ